MINQTIDKLTGLKARMSCIPLLRQAYNWRRHRHAQRVKTFILRWRRPIIVTLDLGLIMLANYVAFWLRFDGHIAPAQQALFWKMLPWVLFIRGIAFSLFRLNEGLWRYTSLWDLQRIIRAVVLSTVVLYCVVEWIFAVSGYPRSVYIVDSILLVGFLAGVRLPARLLRANGTTRKRRKRVLIVGAGDAGEQVVRGMRTSPSCEYDPIGFLDDEASMVGQRIHGIKVLGTREDLSRTVAAQKPEAILLALPKASPAEIRQLLASVEPFKIPIKMLQDLTDTQNGGIAVQRIRDIALGDLLPRAPVDIKSHAVQDMIRGRRVLVTGAGGSIGSELCKQVAQLHPEALVLYERHENSLYTIGKELTDSGFSSFVHPVLGDITDSARLSAVVGEHRPHIIYHAAAHKHVPLMQVNAGEAFKNNCLGTRITAEVAARFGVGRFVLISTDKAVNPSSVMGATKRVAELILQDMANRSRTRFLTVRFGNVLGSNGSVVLRFQEQIQAGGPVTVTHPGVRRYFMLISEAVHLVLQASALGEQGAIYVLDMGEQIKVLDLARNLICLSGFVPGREIPIRFIGLRPGEKLVEELVGEGEEAESSSADKILQIRAVAAPDLTGVSVRLSESSKPGVLDSYARVVERLQQLVPGFQPCPFGDVPGTPSAVEMIEREVTPT